MSTHAGPRDSLVRRALPVYLALLLALFTAVSILLLYALRHVLLILFVSVLFAAALSGPSEWLHDRLRLPRGIAAVLIYVVAFAVLVGVAWLVVPPLLGQVAEFADQAPQYADRYEGVRKAYGELRKDYPALPPFDDQMSRLGNAILDRAGERAASLPAGLFSLFLDMLSVFVISLLLVTNRMRLRGFTLSLVGHGHRDRVAEVLDRSWARIGVYLRAKVIVMAIVGALTYVALLVIGVYLRAKVIVMAIVGTLTYVALLVIGVPFAVPLAIVVAFGELIPRAGPWLARIPLLSIAALEGPRTFVLTLVASILIENLKGYVISPFVEGDQLDIHPLAVFVAVLVGATLAGPAGAFVAVPAAAIVDTLVREIVVPWRHDQIADDDGAARVRLGRAGPRTAVRS